MHLNPYGQDAVLLAVDLANNPPDTPEDLQARCVAAGLIVEHPASSGDLERALAYLARWVGVVDATEPADRAAQLNSLLLSSAAHPRLTDHVGTGWHIHYRDDHIALVGVLRSLISMGTALHLTGRGMHRLSRCAVTGCGQIFADVSRTGRQRYCSPGCANRDAVRRHRAKGPRSRPLTVRVEQVRVLDPQVLELLDALTAELASSGYSDEESFGYSVDRLERGGVHLVGAVVGAEIVGVGGIELQDGAIAEVKRFYVRPGSRGSGVADAVLHALVAYATAHGVAELRLETGDKQHAAIAFYRRHGFSAIARFEPYVHSATSVCMQRSLASKVDPAGGGAAGSQLRRG